MQNTRHEKEKRSRRVQFPFCQITLKAPKPLKDQYSKSLYRRQLKNIGSKLSKKRLLSGISQTELAQQLNVRVETIQNWEHSRSIPAVSYLPKLIQFLEFDPFETPSTLLKLTEKRPINIEIQNRTVPFLK